MYGQWYSLSEFGLGSEASLIIGLTCRGKRDGKIPLISEANTAT